MAKPLDSHWVVVIHILQYLKGTLLLGLHFQKASLANPESIFLTLIGHMILIVDIVLQEQLTFLVPI